jgi:hypothetical protein
MGVEEVPARLHLLPAKAAPVVVVIRRKPAKVFHILRWDTVSDTLEQGSWFFGQLYPLRSDISYDGVWMVYLALGHRGHTWNGLCRVPRLHTVVESENVGTWFGGGYWAQANLLYVNGWPSLRKGELSALPFALAQPLSPTYRGPGDEAVLFARLTRDGWRRANPFVDYYKEQISGGVTWWWKPSRCHPTLRLLYRGRHDLEFSLYEYPDLLGAGIQWATWDVLGQLLVARRGHLERYTLRDIAVGVPAFQQSLQVLTPPMASPPKTPSLGEM